MHLDDKLQVMSKMPCLELNRLLLGLYLLGRLHVRLPALVDNPKRMHLSHGGRLQGNPLTGKPRPDHESHLPHHPKAFFAAREPLLHSFCAFSRPSKGFWGPWGSGGMSEGIFGISGISNCFGLGSKATWHGTFTSRRPRRQRQRMLLRPPAASWPWSRS